MVWQKTFATRDEAHYGDRVVRCFTTRAKDLNQLLRSTVTKHGTREALVAGNARHDYQALDRMAEEIAVGLAHYGVRKGDRVAVLLGNRIEFATAMFGILRLGAIFVPLNTREQESELSVKLIDSGACLLIHEAELADRLPAPATTPALMHRFAVGGDVVGSKNFESLSREGHAPDIEMQEEDAAALLYTSGTTGKPKGAILTHLAMITAAMHYEGCWGLTCEDRAVMAVPASHVTGIVALLLTMVQTGGATIFLSAFKAKDFVKLAAAERMTYTIMVPAMYHLCLLQTEMDARELGAWRVGGYGGSPMPVATIETLAEKFPKLTLVNAYGSTETTSPSTLMPPGDGTAHVYTVGMPVPCCEIRIMDDRGCEVAVGESGEVWIKGGHVVPGYWNNPIATQESFVAGYWRSGDIGSMTADGYLRVFDRMKDMINRGGFKVYSAEVENVLAAHVKVGEAAVVGTPDPVLGERVHAYILPKDTSVTVVEIKAHCLKYLSDYKVPEFVTFVDQPLPRNANGKILKRALKDGFGATPNR